MTINRSKSSNGRNKLEQRRLRLRDWLEIKIDDPNYPGLDWVNREEKIFRIPWKHGARHGWREEEDARLFTEWSNHTGANPRDVKQHKANFRCALNSLRDVTQVHKLSKQKGNDAYRVYQMLPKKKMKQGSVWIRKRKQGAHSESSNSSCPFSTTNSLILPHSKFEFERHLSPPALELPFNQSPAQNAPPVHPIFSSKIISTCNGNQEMHHSMTNFHPNEMKPLASSSHGIDSIGFSNNMISDTKKTSIDTHATFSIPTSEINSTFQFNSSVWNVMKDANDTVMEEEFPQQNNFPESSEQHLSNTPTSCFGISEWDSDSSAALSLYNAMPSDSGSITATNASFSMSDEKYPDAADYLNNILTFPPASEASNHNMKAMDLCSSPKSDCDTHSTRLPTPKTEFIPENENVLEKTFSILQNTFHQTNHQSSHELIPEHKREDWFVSCDSAVEGGKLPSASTLLSPWPMSCPQTEFKGGLQVMSLC